MTEANKISKKQTKRLKLFVWEDFQPDYTSGLAIAISYTEQEAKEKIIQYRGFCVTDWGTLSIHNIDEAFAICVSGGG